MHTLEIYSTVFASIPRMHFSCVYSLRHSTIRTYAQTHTHNTIEKFTWFAKITMEFYAAIEILLLYSVSYDNEFVCVSVYVWKKNDGFVERRRNSIGLYEIYVYGFLHEKKQQQHRSYKIFRMGWIQVTFKIKQSFFSIDICRGKEKKRIKLKDEMNLQSLFICIVLYVFRALLHFIVTWEILLLGMVIVYFCILKLGRHFLLA